MPIVSSPSLTLFYPLDESMPNGLRRNYGEGGATHDLTVSQSTGSDGIPTVSDTRGGRALDLFITRTGWSSAQRGLVGTAYNPGSGHPLLIPLPIASAVNDFAFGCRFQYLGLNTGGGGIEPELIFGLRDMPAGAVTAWGVEAEPDDATAPTAATLAIRIANTTYSLTSGNFTVTGSPPTYYVVIGRWYRLVVRVYFSATGYLIKAYLLEESTGTTYTWTKNAVLTTDYGSSVTTATALRLWIGENGSTTVGLGGYIDECWFYDAGLSETEALEVLAGGLSIPYEAPDYRRADHEVWSSITREGGTFPKARMLPRGTKVSRHPVDLMGHEFRWRVQGWRPGRPWCLTALDLVFDTAGPHGSGKGGPQRIPDLNVGLWRSPGPKPPGALENARNIVHTERGPRRRQGFKVRRSVSTESQTALNSVHTFRTYDGSLYWVYKVGTSLYWETGSGATVLDSGTWSPAQQACGFFFDNRLVLLTRARQRMWDGGIDGVDAISQAASAAPTLAASAGGTLAGTYYYAYTEYDPVTGDETAPAVSANSVTPATQKVTVTMGATLGGRWTKRRIYRTTNGGAPPDLFFVAEIAAATSYNDTGLTDGTELVDQVAGTYITAVAPDTFSLGCVHQERVFYGGGSTYPERIYVTEPNEIMRWHTSFWLTCEGPVRCVIGYGHRLVAFTDHTVEVFESDWIRDDSGFANVNHIVLSRRVGAYGPNAAIVQGGVLRWMDVGGVYQLEGSEPKPISDRIQDIFPYVNRNLARHVVAGYNHVRRQVWWTLPHGVFQDDTTRFQTQVFMQEDDPSRWGIADLEASWLGTFDDDVNGLKFGAMDHLGVLKELEAYEGDGAQGDESYTTEDEGTDGVTNVGIKSISGARVTVYGTPGWTSDGLRGMGVVLRDRSTGLLYYYTIVGNSTGTDPYFDVERTVASALAARDGWFVGGIPAYADGAQNDQGSPNEKFLREVQHAFADLTADLYL